MNQAMTALKSARTKMQATEALRVLKYARELAHTYLLAQQVMAKMDCRCLTAGIVWSMAKVVKGEITEHLDHMYLPAYDGLGKAYDELFEALRTLEHTASYDFWSQVPHLEFKDIVDKLDEIYQACKKADSVTSAPELAC